MFDFSCIQKSFETIVIIIPLVRTTSKISLMINNNYRILVAPKIKVKFLYNVVFDKEIMSFELGYLYKYQF